jgi:hypothetical protein
VIALVSRARRDRVLFERWRDPGDRIDRDAVNGRHSALAHRLGTRHTPVEPFHDIFQVARVGLGKALDRFLLRG